VSSNWSKINKDEEKQPSKPFPTDGAYYPFVKWEEGRVKRKLQKAGRGQRSRQTAIEVPTFVRHVNICYKY
jgi:hypothetical protein